MSSNTPVSGVSTNSTVTTAIDGALSGTTGSNDDLLTGERASGPREQDPHGKDGAHGLNSNSFSNQTLFPNPEIQNFQNQNILNNMHTNNISHSSTPNLQKLVNSHNILNQPTNNSLSTVEMYVTGDQLESILEAREISLLQRLREIIQQTLVSSTVGQSSKFSSVSQPLINVPNFNSTTVTQTFSQPITTPVTQPVLQQVSGINSGIHSSSQLLSTAPLNATQNIPPPCFAPGSNAWLPYPSVSSSAQPPPGFQYGFNPFMHSRSDFQFYSFHKEDPVQWFAQLEDQFNYRGTVDDEPRFNTVMRNLGSDVIRRIAAELRVVRAGEKFNTLKQVLVRKFSDTPQARLNKFFSDSLGSSKPSIFLSRLLFLGDGQLTRNSILAAWQQRLPGDYQLHLLDPVDDNNEHAMVRKADLVFEKIRLRDSAGLNGITATPNDGVLRDMLGVNAISRVFSNNKTPKEGDRRSRSEHRHNGHSRNHSDSRSRSGSPDRRRRDKTPGPGKENGKPELCYYHRNFRTKARKCQSPCTWVDRTPERHKSPPAPKKQTESSDRAENQKNE